MEGKSRLASLLIPGNQARTVSKHIALKREGIKVESLTFGSWLACVRRTSYGCAREVAKHEAVAECDSSFSIFLAKFKIHCCHSFSRACMFKRPTGTHCVVFIELFNWYRKQKNMKRKNKNLFISQCWTG